RTTCRPRRPRERTAAPRAAARVAAPQHPPPPDPHPPQGSTARHGDTHNVPRRSEEQGTHIPPMPTTPTQTATDHPPPHSPSPHHPAMPYSRRHQPSTSSRTVVGDLNQRFV